MVRNIIRKKVQNGWIENIVIYSTSNVRISTNSIGRESKKFSQKGNISPQYYWKLNMIIEKLERSQIRRILNK